jgi:hypothetical protein
MRVALLASGITYPLAGQSGVAETVHSSAADLRIEGSADKDFSKVINGRFAPSVDRGNQSNSISWSTTRVFATAAEAFLFCLDYDARFPRAGTLVLDAVAGGTVTTRRMLDTVVDPPSRSIRGCTVLLSYQATGGSIVPASLVTLYAGIPWHYILQPWDDLTTPTEWEDL